MVTSSSFKYKYINRKLYKLCIKNNIPIIRKKTAKFIYKWTINSKYKLMLEIGTAYGFSANLFSRISSLEQIDTIEHDYENYQIASSFHSNGKINFINENAFHFNPCKKYDLIFLDGPKSNQEVLLLKYIKYLKPNGVIFIDNLYLNKFRRISNDKLSKNQLKLMNKLDKFNQFLKTSNQFMFKEISIDDGLGMVYNKNDEEWFKKRFK